MLSSKPSSRSSRIIERAVTKPESFKNSWSSAPPQALLPDQTLLKKRNKTPGCFRKSFEGQKATVCYARIPERSYVSVRFSTEGDLTVSDQELRRLALRHKKGVVEGSVNNVAIRSRRSGKTARATVHVLDRHTASQTETYYRNDLQQITRALQIRVRTAQQALGEGHPVNRAESYRPENCSICSTEVYRAIELSEQSQNEELHATVSDLSKREQRRLRRFVNNRTLLMPRDFQYRPKAKRVQLTFSSKERAER